MENVEFQEEKSLPQMSQNRTSGLFKIVIGLGLAQNEREAQMILIGLAGIVFLIAFALPFFITTGATYTEPTTEQIQEAFFKGQAK